MQGFLWLLLQMTVLLLAAAMVFFWLGWRWRGQNAAVHAAVLNDSADAESVAAEHARQERETAQAALAQQMIAANREAAELLEAREHQRRLEREILRLSEELKSAKRLTEPAPPPARAPEPTPEPASKPIVPKPPPAPAAKLEVPKPKPKKAPGEPKTTAARMDAQQALANLNAKISSQQILVGALNQEREGWQQRMESLKGKAATDPAGFALTSKNLARSEAQYREAIAALKVLQRQVSALEKTMAAPIPAETDDLTQIKGIKAALDQQLRAFGIHTYRQIALMSGEDLQAFSELLAFKNRAQRDGWQRQAQELHKAKYGSEPSSD